MADKISGKIKWGVGTRARGTTAPSTRFGVFDLKPYCPRLHEPAQAAQGRDYPGRGIGLEQNTQHLLPGPGVEEGPSAEPESWCLYHYAVQSISRSLILPNFHALEAFAKCHDHNSPVFWEPFDNLCKPEP